MLKFPETASPWLAWSSLVSTSWKWGAAHVDGSPLAPHRHHNALHGCFHRKWMGSIEITDPVGKVPLHLYDKGLWQFVSGVTASWCSGSVVFPAGAVGMGEDWAGGPGLRGHPVRGCSGLNHLNSGWAISSVHITLFKGCTSRCTLYIQWGINISLLFTFLTST